MIEVELKNISKTIHKTPILHDINLKFHSGAIYGLKGKNGCGKTMLMRTICGLMIPSTGTVSINGKVLMKDIEFPESIGALIENPAFLPQYTGYKNLCMLASIRSDIDKEAVAEAMRRVQLDPEDKRVYRKYSLGMKQKLGIQITTSSWIRQSRRISGTANPVIRLLIRSCVRCVHRRSGTIS